MPKHQPRAAQRARQAARDGGKYTAALRAELGQRPAPAAGATLASALTEMRTAVQELPSQARLRQDADVAGALAAFEADGQHESQALTTLVEAVLAVSVGEQFTGEDWKVWRAARDLQIAVRHPDTAPPYRLVDDHAFGWITQGWSAEHDDVLFRQDYSGGWSARDRDSSGPLPYTQLLQARGPVRPVVAMPRDDAARLVAEMTRAGRKSLISVLAALHFLWVADLAAHQGEERGHILTAGRGGSWEADTLKRAVYTLGEGAAERRVDEDLFAAVLEVVGRWLYDPDGYVELAEGLAALFARVADSYAGSLRGMAIIADQWVVRHEGLESLRNWALSRSEHHGPSGW
ncbi:hypothetical protein ACIBH1_46930 [Nonomuraea sp. NPDC050663]|uniref:hypothetical protein n=1 Tax=Nonomuraea sp. NPDC050663 TaxID=3364370 RepID=UPI0037AC1804